ncbi:MAG: acyltransferase family protein [Lautropia sp.]
MSATESPTVSTTQRAPLPARVDAIQWLRGMAAMLVVFDHAALLALENAPQAGGAWRLQWFNLAWLGGIGVDVFFVISGFVMALSATRFTGPIGAAHFLLQRYNRIAPLYYLLSAVLLADMLRAAVHIDVNEVVNTFTFIPLLDVGAYSWPIHYLGWTLAFEFVFYVLVASLIARSGGLSHRWLLALLVALPFVGIAWPGTWLPWRMLTSPMMWEFALGVAIFLGWRAGVFTRHRRAGQAGFVIAVLAATLPAMTDWPIVERAAGGYWSRDGATIRFLCWGVPAALVVAAGFTLAPDAPGIARPALRLLGDMSYSLYLSHLFVVRLMLEAIQRFGLDPMLAMVAVVVVSPFVAWVVYRLLEQPLLRLGQTRVRALVTMLRARADARAGVRANG